MILILRWETLRTVSEEVEGCRKKFFFFFLSLETTTKRVSFQQQKRQRIIVAMFGWKDYETLFVIMFLESIVVAWPIKHDCH